MIVYALVVVVPPKYFTLVSSGKASNHSYTFPPKVNGIEVFKLFPSVRVTLEYMTNDFTHSLIISSVLVTQSMFRTTSALVNGYACPGCGKTCLSPIRLVRGSS